MDSPVATTVTWGKVSFDKVYTATVLVEVCAHNTTTTRTIPYELPDDINSDSIFTLPPIDGTNKYTFSEANVTTVVTYPSGELSFLFGSNHD